MGSFRTVILPVFLSLGIHAVMGWSVGQHWQAGGPEGPQTVQISYPETPVAAPPVVPPARASAPAARKKLKGIPVPRLPLETESAKAVEPTDFQKQLEVKLKKQRLALSKLSAEQADRAEPSQARPKTSAEILADPQKGKLFIGYFSDVKKKIQKTLVDRFSQRYTGRGSVTLAFVLSSEGFVEKVTVLPKGTQGDADLHDLAVQCLREAAPFGAFPSELGSDHIAFNVTIFFDGR